MKRIKKVIGLCLALALTLSIFNGCGGEPTPSSATKTDAEGSAVQTGLDTSQAATVEMWMTGSEPRDLAVVAEKLNEQSKEKLNTTVNFNFFNTSDTQQKYMMLLSSGVTVDLIYSANWLSYPANVRKGAFQPLDDMLPKAAPKLWEGIPKATWDDTRVDGKINMIPTTTSNYGAPAFVYREDLRKKYNCAEIKDLKTMEDYLTVIAEKEKDMMPTSQMVTSVGNLGSYFTAWGALDCKYKWVDWRMPYGLMIPYDDPTNVTSYWESDDFREDMKMFKRWSEKGFWSRSSLSSQEDHVSLFRNGKTSAIVSSLNGWVTTYSDAKSFFEQNNPDWEAGVLVYEQAKGLAIPKHATQDGFSVTITAKQPERALAVYELFYLDEAANKLIRYGIEGTHYSIDKDGYYELIGSNENSGFTSGAMRAWGIDNDKFSIPTKNSEVEKEILAPSKEYMYRNLYTAFPEDSTKYQTERAALFNVVSQYLTPIQGGMVEDVDKAIDEFIEKAKVAGLEKIQEGFKEQWVAYLNDNSIKPSKIEVK